MRASGPLHAMPRNSVEYSWPMPMPATSRPGVSSARVRRPADRTSGWRAVMFAMPLAMPMRSVASSSRPRCARMSREDDPSGTQSAEYPIASMSAASRRIWPAGRTSNAKVQAPTRPSRARTAS